MLDVLRPRLLRVRPVHLETPASYLERLCAANCIDGRWLLAQVRRGRFPGVKSGVDAIAAYGGPGSSHWTRSHDFASVGIGFPGTSDAPSGNRLACLSCTAGERVQTYGHIRFSFCRRHGQWLGAAGRQRHGVLDETLWGAELQARRLVARGRVDDHLFDSAWQLVRDHRFLVERKTWSRKMDEAYERAGFTRGSDDRFALYPETVRAMTVISQPTFETEVRRGTFDGDVRRDLLLGAISRD